MASSNSMKVQVAMDASGLVDGAKQATGALKDISQEVSNADSNFKSIRSEINKQQSEVNKLANAYMQMRDKYGETSAAALDYKEKLDTSVQSLAKLKAENEGVQNAIRQATQAIMQEGNAVQQSSQQIQSVAQRFEEIKNSGEPMKQQLRELKGLLAEMNFNGQGMSAEFNEVAQYAGKLKDAISDANTATNVFANDTANLQAVIQSVQLVTAGFSALKGTMSMLGIENKNFEATMKKIQGAMLTLNALQQIANLLNKNSILIQRLQVTWYKVKDAVLKAQTISLKANTAAEAINTAGTKLSTIAQNAWNVAKAIAKALLGDFTGLLIVGIGALATYAMATSDSTEEIEKQTDALANNTNGIDDNTDAVDKNKKAQEEWAKDVASSCAEQISTYRMLQQKWNECNGDVKLQGKFMRDYKSEIDSLGLGIHNLLDAEKAFVSYTDSVVAAIYARARAEAYKNQITKSTEREIELMMQNEKDMTYTWKPAGDKEHIWAEEANKIGLGQGDYSYHNIHTGEYTLTEQGKAKINAYRKQQGYEQWRKRHNDRVAEIYGERENQAALRKLQQREVDIVSRELAKAGLSAKDYSSATGGGAKSVYGNYGRHSGSGGRGHSSRGGSGGSGKGGSGGSGKGGDKGPSDQEVLRGLEEKILDMKQNLTLDLIPEGEVDNYVQELAKFTQKYDELAEKLGAPLYGSLDWKKKELADLQRNMTSGYIDEKDLDNARDKVELLKKEIEDEEIELGIKEPKALEGSLQWLEDEYNKLQNDLSKGLIPDEKIDEANKKLEDFADRIVEKKIQLRLQEPPETDYEKTEKERKKRMDDYKLYLTDRKSYYAQKQKELDEYNKAYAEYQQKLEEYNRAQNKYQEDLKKYNKYLEYRKKLEKELSEGKIDDVEYNEKLNDYIKKHYQLAQSIQTEADANDQLEQALAEVKELYDSGLMSLEQYQQRVNEIQSNTSIKLDEVITNGVGKPTVPVQPTFDMQKPEIVGLDVLETKTKRELEDFIQTIDRYISENELTHIEIIDYHKVRDEAQRRLDELSHDPFVINIKARPSYIESGSADWYAAQYEAVAGEINRIMSLYDQGIIKTTKERNDEVNKLQRQLTALGLKPVVIELKTKGQEVLDNITDKFKQFKNLTSSLDGIKSLVQSIQEGADAWTIFTNALDASISIFETLNTLIGIFNTLKQASNAVTKESTTLKEGETVATTAQTAANIGEASSSIAKAGASGAEAAASAAAQNSSMGPWGWIAGIAAAIAVAGAIFGIISQAKGFAGGGIVDGSSKVGDKLYARLNGGEMVLNNRQQQHLMNIVNGAPLNSNATHLTTAEVKIRGNDLYAVLNNTAKTKSLVGKNIGIR